MKTIIVAALLISALSASAQKSSTALWETGNSFLAQCDESNPHWAALQWDAANKATQLNICSLWLTGFRQGIELLQQIRPFRAPSTAEAKANTEHDEYLKKQYGIMPDLAFTEENICIPEDVTNDQLRLVVIRWMKDNPTKLTQHATFVGYSALQSAYACRNK
jgi:Rap1a immunity proteins